MLKKFEVKNFKNFKEKITLDFSKIHNYDFNQNLIKNGLINKMLIYGENNSGKSNLGAAIMDIKMHLTDNNSNNNLLYTYYLNGDCIDSIAEFSYEFVFNDNNVIYSYGKDNNQRLLYEELKENDNLLFKYNYTNNHYENNIPEAKNIVIAYDIDAKISMSVLKYIYANTLNWNEYSSIKLLFEFVNNMLWFRSIKYNDFFGLLTNKDDMHNYIIENNLINDFQEFLNGCGQNYNLCVIEETGSKFIGVTYKNYKARFDIVSSTGTQSLWLFYYWMNRKKDISFVFIDEFDAFYHYSLALYILKYLNNNNNFQSVLTSHNTFLINNELMRPDCYSILKDGKITSFADSTNKVIRQAHNLEKLMLGGEFEK